MLGFSREKDVATQEKLFHRNRQAFEEIKELALGGELSHNAKCAAESAFEIPKNYSYLFSDPNECIYVVGKPENMIIELSIRDFYKPIVYTQLPDKYNNELWDIDGSDLKRTKDLGGNWFLTIRDWN